MDADLLTEPSESAKRLEGETELALARFWDLTRRRANGAGKSTQPYDCGPRGADANQLRAVLALGCGANAGRTIVRDGTTCWARTTPSAGARYPFEVLVWLPDHAGVGVFYWFDCERNRLVTQRLSNVVPGRGDSPVRRPGGGDPTAVVVLLARPWRTMAKYGWRGWRYTQLDIGHAAVNIALSASAAGLDAVTHLRFDRLALARSMGLNGQCREPQVAVSVRAPAASGTSGFPGCDETSCDHPCPQEPTAPEQRCWAALERLGLVASPVRAREAFGDSPPLIEPCGGRAVALAPSASPDIEHPGVFAQLVRARASACGFRDVPIGIDALGEILAATRGTITLDCADRLPRLGLALLAGRVDGLVPGVYHYSPASHALAPAGLSRPEWDEVGAACLGQNVVRRAAAILVLHAPVRRLLATAAGGAVAEVHLFAAHVAQRLHLRAVQIGIGTTCIGGFVDEALGAFTRLGPGNEVLYVMALGTTDPHAVKGDRS